MSRLQTVCCHRVGIPLNTPFVTALRRATTVDSLLVEIVDSDGLAWVTDHVQTPIMADESVFGVRDLVRVTPIGTTTVNDLDAAWWLERPPGPGGLTYEGASIVLPDAPGLGIEEVARP